MKYFGLTESESSSGLFGAIIDTFTICYWSYEVCVPWVRGGEGLPRLYRTWPEVC